jgi:hypothetical protein
MLVMSTVKPLQILVTEENVEKLPATFIREGYYWLKEVYNNEYAAVMKIRKLLPEDMWARREAWGDEEFQETVLLKERLVRLRKAWVSRDRPDFYKKGKRSGEIKKATNKTKSN